MKIYRIAQDSSGLCYHGSREVEKTPTVKDFPGVFFASSPEAAKSWGNNVAVYRITTQKLFKPNTIDLAINPTDFSILEKFINKYGYTPSSSNQKWNLMGATTNKINKLTKENYIDVLGQVLLFPTKEWVEYLKGLGYYGFINYEDVFLFNLNQAQYVGQYDFKKNRIINK